MEKICYTVSFSKMTDYGGILKCDGTTNVDDYEEEFYTENYDEALKEFEDRKREITADNNLAVIMDTWVNDEGTDQLCYSSKDILDKEFLDRPTKMWFE